MQTISKPTAVYPSLHFSLNVLCIKLCIHRYLNSILEPPARIGVAGPILDQPHRLDLLGQHCFPPILRPEHKPQRRTHKDVCQEVP